jgi:hypothetical protein
MEWGPIHHGTRSAWQVDNSDIILSGGNGLDQALLEPLFPLFTHVTAVFLTVELHHKWNWQNKVVAAPPGDILITYSFLLWQDFIKFRPIAQIFPWKKWPSNSLNFKGKNFQIAKFL